MFTMQFGACFEEMNVTDVHLKMSQADLLCSKSYLTAFNIPLCDLV